jgi:hypothetical protein
MAYTRAELLAMSDEERTELCEVLASLGVTPPPARQRERRRRLLAGAALTAAAVLCAWTIGLIVTLPQHEVVEQWRLVWVGFDVAEVAGFATTGWAALRRRQLVIPAALVTGTLLLCDAWFDVVLSWGSDEELLSLLTAFLVEIPLALLLWMVAHRLAMLAFSAARVGLGLPGRRTSLRHLALMTQPPSVWPGSPRGAARDA